MKFLLKSSKHYIITLQRLFITIISYVEMNIVASYNRQDITLTSYVKHKDLPSSPYTYHGHEINTVCYI